MIDLASGKLKTHYEISCYDNWYRVPKLGIRLLKRKKPKLKWIDEFDNLVVTQGLNDVLDATFKSGTIVPNPTTTPTIAPTGGGASGGSLQSGNYYLKYTFYNAQGETLVSTESAQFTVASGKILPQQSAMAA